MARTPVVVFVLVITLCVLVVIGLASSDKETDVKVDVLEH